jgi:transposase
MLDAFVTGVSAYSLRADAQACIASMERFYRLIRACCAIDACVNRSAFRIEHCELAGPRNHSGFRGWSTATRVLVLSIAEHEGAVVVGAPGVPQEEAVPLLRRRTAVGGVYAIDSRQALANLQVRGNYVVVNAPRASSGSPPNNAIDAFWCFAKDRLHALRKIPAKFFHLYLGEMCFRFNHRNDDLKILLCDRLHSISIAHARAVIDEGPKSSGVRDILASATLSTVGVVT